MPTIAQDRAQLGYVLDDKEGEAFWLLGMLQTIKIGSDDGGGAGGSDRDRRTRGQRLSVARPP